MRQGGPRDESFSGAASGTNQAAVAAYVLPRLHLRADGAPCTSRVTAHLVDHHTDGAYAVLRFAVDCRREPRVLELDYRLFFDLDPQHRAYVREAASYTNLGLAAARDALVPGASEIEIAAAVEDDAGHAGLPLQRSLRPHSAPHRSRRCTHGRRGRPRVRRWNVLSGLQ